MSDDELVQAPQAPLTPLRRNRDFMLLWSGQVASTVGTRVSGVAFPLLVLSLTGSPVQAGLVGFAQTLAFPILFPFAGVIVDRVDRKRLLLLSDGARALAFTTLVVALALDSVTLGHILVVAFLEGTFFVFFRLAETAALPQVVPKEQLQPAVAQNQARDQGAELVGAPLGGFLFGRRTAVRGRRGRATSWSRAFGGRGASRSSGRSSSSSAVRTSRSTRSFSS